MFTYKCFIWDGRKRRDLCKKNYTKVLYGTDGNIETYAKKVHKCFIWDGRKHRDLCKKNYTNVLYETDGNVETYAKKITQMFHMRRTET